MGRVTPIGEIPAVVDNDFVVRFRESLTTFSDENPAHMRKYLHKDIVIDILKRCQAIVGKEGTLVEARVLFDLVVRRL